MTKGLLIFFPWRGLSNALLFILPFQKACNGLKMSKKLSSKGVNGHTVPLFLYPRNCSCGVTQSSHGWCHRVTRGSRADHGWRHTGPRASHNVDLHKMKHSSPQLHHFLPNPPRNITHDRPAIPQPSGDPVTSATWTPGDPSTANPLGIKTLPTLLQDENTSLFICANVLQPHAYGCSFLFNFSTKAVLNYVLMIFRLDSIWDRK